MIKEWNYQINATAKRVINVIWNDPVLTLLGEDWSFNTLSSWRLIKDGILIDGFDSPVKIKALDSLIGCLVRGSIGPSGIDPIILCESGLTLEIFVTQALEPWTYHDSDGTIVGI